MVDTIIENLAFAWRVLWNILLYGPLIFVSIWPLFFFFMILYSIWPGTDENGENSRMEFVPYALVSWVIIILSFNLDKRMICDDWQEKFYRDRRAISYESREACWKDFTFIAVMTYWAEQG